MRQPIKKSSRAKNIVKRVMKPRKRTLSTAKKDVKRYGTSKLEKYFADNFLDKYGIKYIYEYEAKDIGRFYDFAVVTKKSNYITENKEGLTSIVQGVQYAPVDLLIEVDGGFWHSDPRFVDESKLTAMQKHNRMVDDLKNRWASFHGIPLLRFWEHDIKHNHKKILSELKKYVSLGKNLK